MQIFTKLNIMQALFSGLFRFRATGWHLPHMFVLLSVSNFSQQPAQLPFCRFQLSAGTPYRTAPATLPEALSGNH